MATSSNVNIFRVTGLLCGNSPVKSPHKSQWREALMFSLTCAWTNSWANKGEISDLRRHRAHHDVTLMWHKSLVPQGNLYFTMWWFILLPKYHKITTFCSCSWLDWIGLDLFNDDTRPSGHISRPAQVNVSQSGFHSLNNYSSLIILYKSGG